ncbi:hypothetical protein LX16_3093 [Stackebrandtia albiflava]|uniref:Mce-associated membrane protein n=1 Tax=Stackebrandtia albiflava TaxID=406432 RepID=A0A562V3E9_9ACTN|nr:hypothetical protein [Stackebrandtia albiflava]TWJ12337.1 hypothetical protein LX16_3093 [Stackebrandtia albiflava]
MKPARLAWWLPVNIALALLLLAALGTAGVFGFKWWDAWRADTARDAAVANATEGVLALMSVSPETIDSDLAAVEALATGEFAEELAAGRDQVRESVLGAAVTQEATVEYAAYVSGDSDSATVILVADAVTTAAAPPPEGEEPAEEGETPDEESTPEPEDGGTTGEPITDHYRFRVQMALVEGQWLIGRLEVA